MRTFLNMSLIAAIAMVNAAFTGCGENEVAEPVAPVETAAETPVLPPEIATELASLSESDRQLAIEQRICPVTDGMLGSMGTPKKLTVEGREVFICCDGCEEKLRSDPERYFAKIGNQ